MRAGILSFAVLAVLGTAAAAQPGRQPPGWGGAPPTYATAPRYHLLSEEERDLLARGEISEGAHVGGGLVGTVFGWGLGHLVQGRYVEKGWIFTAGEAVSTILLISAMADCYHLVNKSDLDDDDGCENHAGFWVGLVGALGFRIWEIIDVWGGPPAHNARVREIRWRAGLPPYGLFLAPSLGRGDGGGVAGLTLRF